MGKLVLHKSLKLNMWLTALKGATQINYISATDWQITVQISLNG